MFNLPSKLRKELDPVVHDSLCGTTLDLYYNTRILAGDQLFKHGCCSSSVNCNGLCPSVKCSLNGWTKWFDLVNKGKLSGTGKRDNEKYMLMTIIGKLGI